MKNYYDELEVSKTASKEVIEKAYKVLAKKYHPDMNQGEDKILAEEKFKLISEAYEILSNDEKRKQYDIELEHNNPTISYEEYEKVMNERNSLNNSLNNLRNSINNQQNINYYNQRQSSNSNNNYQQGQASNYNNNYQNQSTKHKYYYTDTGKPASALSYYIYRIKTFFKNLGIILLAILAFLLMINAFLGI